MLKIQYDTKLAASRSVGTVRSIGRRPVVVRRGERAGGRKKRCGASVAAVSTKISALCIRRRRIPFCPYHLWPARDLPVIYRRNWHPEIVLGSSGTNKRVFFSRGSFPFTHFRGKYDFQKSRKWRCLVCKMFPRPRRLFLSYLEVPSGHILKNPKNIKNLRIYACRPISQSWNHPPGNHPLLSSAKCLDWPRLV